MVTKPDKSSSPPPGPRDWRQALRSHPRAWQSNRYVYPVLSRRARGISIGVNLSPDQVCNFRCVYCQVDRSRSPLAAAVDLDRLRAELDAMLDHVVSGRLFDQPPFADAPAPMRRVADIAFSGDGEPTASPVFPEAVRIALEAKAAHRLPADMRIVVLTNATLLDAPKVRKALDALHAGGGEIWAKLDAGSQEHYARMNRCPIPLDRIVDNIALAAKRWRVRIQSMWLRLGDQAPGDAEVEAFCNQISRVLAAGRLEGVQVYTLARQPAESYVTPLPEDHLRAIAATIATRTRLPVEVFPSPS